VSATTGDRASTGGADDARMPLVEHIREFRTRLIRSVLAILAGCVAGWFFYEQIVDVLIEPVCQEGIKGVADGRCKALVVTGIIGPLSLQLKVSFFAGLILASPVWLYQLWAFLAPGLHKHEKRWAFAFVGTGLPLFALGGGLAYLIMPTAVKVLLNFTPGDVGSLVTFDEYLDFVLRMLLVFGLSFELPLLLILANLSGIMSARRIRAWWRGMVMGIFVFAAAATPTGDPLTMGALALPMILLYGVAIVFTTLRERRRARREEAAKRAEPGPQEKLP
jgi:sec-independent protein translocase protein TatC